MMEEVKALNVEPFKKWLLESCLYQVAICNLPKDDDIHLELGEKLQIEHWDTETMPCGKCASGETEMNVHYTARDITVVSGMKMEHEAFIYADAVTQALWASLWEQGYIVPNFKRVDVDGDGQWDILAEYNFKNDTYEPLMGIA